MMRVWHDFLDSLDTDGGHILLLAVLMVIGMIGMELAIMKAEDVVIGAFGALLLALKSAGSNKERRDTATVVTQVKTEEDTDKPGPKL